MYGHTPSECKGLVISLKLEVLHQCVIVNTYDFAIFGLIFMTFSTKYRSKALGMLFTIILESFCSILFWEGANVQNQIRPRKIPDVCDRFILQLQCTKYKALAYLRLRS